MVAWCDTDRLRRGGTGDVPGGGGPVIGDYVGVRDAIEDGLEALYAGDAPSAVQADMQAAADRVIEAYNVRVER